VGKARHAETPFLLKTESTQKKKHGKNPTRSRVGEDALLEGEGQKKSKPVLRHHEELGKKNRPVLTGPEEQMVTRKGGGGKRESD